MSKSLTLQKRILGGLVVVMMMFALITGYLVTRLGAVKSGAEDMRATAVDVENINQAVKSLDDFMIGALLLITNLQATGTDSVSELDATFATLDASLAALDRHQDPDIRDAVRELHADADPIAESWTKARSYFQEGRMSEGLAVALPMAQPHIDPALETLKKLNVITSKISDGTYSGVSDIYSDSRSLGLVGIGVSVGLSLLVMWFLVRSVSSSVGRGAGLVASSSGDLGAVSARMGTSAQETASQAEIVTVAAGRVSDSVQTVASAVEEMTASVREIAQNAGEASRVAEQAVEVAEATNATVSKLGVSSAEIGEVIAVITSIAEQTNLLALNATIEAARAGEAGKGFAVVANEVKELAKETAKATDDISGKIAAIQSDTGGAVEAIRRIGAIIAQISGIQNTIAAAVEEQTATTNEIARNVSDAARGSAEIADNIASVAGAARATTEGAVAIQDAATGLAEVAHQLQSLVGSFEGAARPPMQSSGPWADDPFGDRDDHRDLMAASADTW